MTMNSTLPQGLRLSKSVSQSFSKVKEQSNLRKNRSNTGVKCEIIIIV